MSGRPRRYAATRRSVSAREGRAGRPVVLKLGGELLETPQRIEAVGGVIAGLQGGNPLVVVHGGGRDIDAALARAGIAKQQIDGLRITDDATLDVVVSVLAGLVNTRLVAAVTVAGGDGVGLTGADTGLGLVEKAAPHAATNGSRVDLGRVGIPVDGRSPHLLVALCQRGYIPIVASIGTSRSGELYNVNADTFAAHLAGILGADRLIIAGGTAGVLDERGETIAVLGLEDIDRLVSAGTATSGMIAKLSACRDALSHGVREVLIADGRDLAGVTRLVRRGARAEVPGCTQMTSSLSPPRTQGSNRRSGTRPQSSSKNRNFSAASVPGR